MTPDSLKTILRQAETQAAARQWSAAVEILVQGLRRFGNDVELLFSLSRCYFALKKYSQAEQFALRVLEHDPRHVRAVLQLAWVAWAEQDTDRARHQFERAIELGSDDWKTRSQLGLLEVSARNIGQAEEHFTRALELGCPNSTAVCNLANLLMLGGRVDESLVLLAPMLKAFPEDTMALQTAATCLNYAEETTAEEVFEMHRRFGAALSASVSPLPLTEETSYQPDRTLRVGYLSADFRAHSVAHFLLAVVEQHRRDNVEVVLYSVGQDDEVTERFQSAADQWRPCRNLEDEVIAETIRADKIDVLVELCGLFDGHRLGVLARRAAPVQVTYCGYPNTTGLTEVDFRIVDSTTDPAGSERLATEELVRIDPCFLGYRPLVQMDSSQRKPRAEDRPLTFGSFNNLAKISAPLLDAWCTILQRTPGSRLALKSTTIHDPVVRERLLDEFSRRGIGQDRLQLLDFTKSMTDHLNLYHQVDIGLDTFPYHGTTTTCEALSMGVPVVSLRGDRHASRVGASLLSAVGHSEWIAQSWPEYIDKACQLAEDESRLREYQRTLAAELFASDLCRIAPFVERLEAAYRMMWRRRCHQADGSGGS